MIKSHSLFETCKRKGVVKDCDLKLYADFIYQNTEIHNVQNFETHIILLFVFIKQECSDKISNGCLTQEFY